MTDIVERLLDYSKDDHERGCQGRYYDCSCGYDDKRDPLMVEAAKTIASLRDEITRLRAALREITDFDVFGFAITDTHTGGDVFCEGTNRFAREDDVVKIRRTARAALGEDKIQ